MRVYQYKSLKAYMIINREKYNDLHLFLCDLLRYDFHG
jgi:hypothetical protein